MIEAQHSRARAALGARPVWKSQSRNRVKFDLVAEESLIVEIKRVARLDQAHVTQVLTDLQLTDIETALLLNFNDVMLGGPKQVSFFSRSP